MAEVRKVFGDDHIKIHLANSSKQLYGGGFSWAHNFTQAMDGHITDYPEADIYLIPSPTMVSRDEVLTAQHSGKKIVLRLDNAVRNSRNRNTGMSRLKDFAEWADLVIYQSQWAKDYLTPFTRRSGPVIMNGVDLDVFKPGTKNPNVILYSRFNRDETKNWEVARYCYSEIQKVTPQVELWIVGNFSPDLAEANFDFYMDERFKFWGVQEPANLAGLYAQAGYFMYTYYNDACSNSLIEALASGCTIEGPRYFLETGGAPEIMARFAELGRDYFGLTRMANAYIEALSGL